MSEKPEHFEDYEKKRLLLQDFARKLNVEPNPAEFEKTPDGRANTLPISFVEMTLDEIYLGRWSHTDAHFQQIFNEVVGTVELTVIHPITNEPITRTGWASVVITQDSGSKVSDFNMTKKMNALDLSFPKLGAEALKNAAKSLGKVFGRDINRKQKDTFKPVLKPLSDAGMMDAIKRIESGKLETIALAEENFLLTDVQKEVLRAAVPKLLSNG